MSEAAPKIRPGTGSRDRLVRDLSAVRWRLRASLPFALGVALIAFAFQLTHFAHELERRYGLDLMFAVRGPALPPQGALIVSIDRQSIAWLRQLSGDRPPSASRLVACLPASAVAELGRVKDPSALPRSVHACLLDELNRIGFPVVVFDILFSVAGHAEDDLMLAKAMRAHSATVILSGVERYAIEQNGVKLFVDQNRQPLALLREAAAGAGPFLVPRQGGTVQGYWRRSQAFGDQKSLIDVTYSLLGNKQKSAGASLRQDDNFTYLWLYGPPRAIATISIRDVLSGDLPDEVRKRAIDTVAFVGASDPSLTFFTDSFPSLYQSETETEITAVELAATAFLNLKSGHILGYPPWYLELIVVTLFALLLGLAASMSRSHSLLVIFGLALAYLATAFVIFSQWRLFVPVIVPVFIAAPAAGVMALALRSKTAMALAMRLAPAPIARQMLEAASGERGEAFPTKPMVDATVVFFDIIGSTKIGEQMPNHDFVGLMNDFHDAITREVEAHGGFVTAFAGDGVTALFDVTNAGPDHALLACRAAISGMREIRSLNRANAKRDMPAIGMRIGMNSGLVAEASIGARKRFNFSVVGDAVNIAAHLEKLGKEFFPDENEVILVAAATHRRVHGHDLVFADCGLHSIAGRQESENVFRLLVA